MAILVTGGAGYVGVHVVNKLKEEGYRVVVIDNFSTSHPQYVDGVTYFRVSYDNKAVVKMVIEKYRVDMVIHLGGLIDVKESEEKPDLYYAVNVKGTEKLLQAMKEKNVTNIVFSSTCAVYGEVKENPITENHEKNPVSVYGNTKREVEKMLFDYEMNYIILRFFNVAGASEKYGEKHKKETHLIPNLFEASEKNTDFVIYGNGLNKRDFVHVLDLAEAHVQAVSLLFSGIGKEVYNIGSGRSYSINQVINSYRIMFDKALNIKMAKKRKGDAFVLEADIFKAVNELSYRPKYNIDDILISYGKWRKGGNT